ncbi:peroxiredoxin-like family protein [Mesorhizobium delmotii]|uniref:Thioredoxin domain-containing protein n=1 Tax=Mesorhizobium delmotii TaxID=1631247 RepID=A0A2P9AD64_9HYPH|nr:peroxiredoxin-like family protein [Mesorhizobium delmotii]SJM29022.1 conserved hypothetical protein [Mesorhizobium delmotii]
MAAVEQVMTFEQAVQAAIDLDAPLSERLAVIAAAIRRLDASYADAADRMVMRLQDKGAGATAPRPGDAMPAFLLPDEDGRLVSLAGVLANGPVAITFLRGHWCPFCRLNAIGIVEVQQEIAAMGGQVVAITPERRKFSAALKNRVGAEFPFLTDMDNGYALSLDLAIGIGVEMQQLLGAGGDDLPSYQDNAAWLLPIPATFIVGADGIITARYVDPDYQQRMEIEDLVSALERAR